MSDETLPVLKAEAWFCPSCGITKADMDGCCAYCGRDCEEGPALLLPDDGNHVVLSRLRLDRVLRDWWQDLNALYGLPPWENGITDEFLARLQEPTDG